MLRFQLEVDLLDIRLISNNLAVMGITFLEPKAQIKNNTRDEIISFLSQRGVLRGDDLLHCDHLPSLHGGGGDQLHREYCLRHLLFIGKKTIISKTNCRVPIIMTTGAKAVYNNPDRAKHLKCVPGADHFHFGLDNE